VTWPNFSTIRDTEKSEDLIQILPPHKLEEIMSQLSAAQNGPGKVTKILKSCFSDEQMQEALKNAAEDAVTNYLIAIDSTLSDSQRENLIQVLEKYSPSQPVPPTL
jgi:hypothetical protein